MNRFLNYFLSMTMIAALLAVTSCGEDPIEEAIDAPSITLDGVAVGEESETTVDVGEEVAFNVVVNAPGRFNTLLVERTMADGTTVTDTTVSRDNTVQNSITFPFSYTPTAEEEGETVVFDFTAVDEDGRENTYTYTVMVNEQEVVSYNAILLAAPTEDQTNEVWFSTSTGQRYSTEEVNTTTENLSSQIDFGYRFGPSAGATLASPAAYPTEGNQNMTGWSTLNETMLRRVSTGVTEEQFLEMGTSAAAIETAYEGGTAGANPQRLAGLQEGEVLAFMTDADKGAGSQMGLIYVEEINLGADGSGFGSDAYILLNIKVTD
jgi:hypothetical protein